MIRYRYAITLRIRHPALSAAEICAAIPFPPRRTWSVGEARTTPKGDPLAGRHAESYAAFPLGEGVDELAAALAQAVERLAPQRDFLRAAWGEGGSAELFVGWFLRGGNTGEDLDPALLVRLGDLGLRLALDLYPDGA